MTTDINIAIAHEHTRDLRATLDSVRRAQRVGARDRDRVLEDGAGAARADEAVAIRISRADDARALASLARLDGDGFLAERFAVRAASGDVLLAEMGGAVVAAVILGEGRVVADPFRPSSLAVDLLRLRAAQLGSLPHEPRRPLLGALRPRLH